MQVLSPDVSVPPDLARIFVHLRQQGVASAVSCQLATVRGAHMAEKVT